MAPASKVKGRRFTPELRQEDRSAGQLQDRMGELGWNLSRLKDLGEDFLVQIYHQGLSTGLAFLVQLKSTAGKGSLRVKSMPGVLRYRLEVKDLLHWEVSTTFMVLIVWDVSERAGYWQPVPAMIRELDEGGKGWREKGKVTVSVPLSNSMSEEGARRLRGTVADHNLSLVGQPMALEISFSTTEQGTAGLHAFKNALDTGAPVTLEGDRVPHIEFPSWYRRLYGYDDIKPSRVKITPQAPTWSIAVAAEARSPGLIATIPFIELRPTSLGRKRVTLTNEHQLLPLRIRVHIDTDDPSPSISFGQILSVDSVYQAKETLAFMLAAGSPRGVIRLTNSSTGELFAAGEAKEPFNDVELSAMRLQHELLEKLCFIEGHIARYGSLSLKGGITRKDVLAADLLFHIFKYERLNVTMNVSFSVSPDILIPSAQRESFEMVMKGAARIKLLNLVIPLGTRRVVPSDPSSIVQHWREAHARAQATMKPVSLDFDELPVVVEYPDWARGRSPWDQLYDIASSQAGYFDLDQAREAGHHPEALDSMVQARTVSRLTENVFRIVHFLPSDHEDLVLVWMETERKGVFSHDTALALHDLSDTLPARRHITVPMDWEEGRRTLEANVVIHRAPLDESEITWHGTVPVTKPLRTLRDCINDGVAQEFIDQAIAEGIQRGLFTKADLQRRAVSREQVIRAEPA